MPIFALDMAALRPRPELVCSIQWCVLASVALLTLLPYESLAGVVQLHNGGLRVIGEKATSLPSEGLPPLRRSTPVIHVTLRDAEGTRVTQTEVVSPPQRTDSPTPARRLLGACARKAWYGNITVAYCQASIVDVGTCQGTCISRQVPRERTLEEQADGSFAVGYRKPCRCCTAHMQMRNATVLCFDAQGSSVRKVVRYQAVESCSCKKCSADSDTRARRN